MRNTQQQHAADYSEENRLLRQLFQQRNKNREQPEEIQDEAVEKQIKKQEDKPKSIKTNNLLLNMLVYDKREHKPDFFIKIFALFNEDPKNAKPLSISKNIQSIFITTFGFQIETLQGLLERTTVPIYLLNHSDNQEQTKIVQKYGGYENLTLILPCKKTSGYGVFHIKLWLVKFKTFLRVVISTSNQHLYDWTIWSNAYWYQDFSLKSVDYEQKQHKYGEFNYVSDFQRTLKEVVDEILPVKNYLQENIKINLDNYDFNGVRVVLIPSIPGRYEGQSIKRQGIGKVKEVMKKMGKKIKKPTLTYCSTSLGVIEELFVREIYFGFCPAATQFKLENYRLIYPTNKYIKTETCGQSQVLFLTEANYQKSEYKKKIFYKFDTNSKNPILGCIPHLKVVVIEDEENEKECILYVGSHNMTKAAWGKTQKNGKLFISNSQLGLLFMDYELEELREWLPFQYPPQPYKAEDVPYFRM